MKSGLKAIRSLNPGQTYMKYLSVKINPRWFSSRDMRHTSSDAGGGTLRIERSTGFGS